MSAPRGTAWSDEDERLLVALWNSGASGSEIGVIMHRSKNAIIAHAWRRGLMGRGPSHVPLEQRRTTSIRQRIVGHGTGPRPVTPGEAAAALAAIPQDTRTPMQRMMGDPLPGRSALDRQKGAGVPVDKWVKLVNRHIYREHIEDRHSNEEAVQ